MSDSSTNFRISPGLPATIKPASGNPLPYTEAARLVLEHASSHFADFNSANHGVEQLPLIGTLGRVLAEPLVADRNQPPFPRSTRDGFACRADDAQKATPERPLIVLGLLRAGEPWDGAALSEGQAVEIMTGAPVPPGADCVVMIEHVVTRAAGQTLASTTSAAGAGAGESRVGSSSASFFLSAGRTIAEGANIIPRAAEARVGSPLLAAGTRLGAPQIAVAAACGRAQLSVLRRPRVAILSTGDELVELDAQPLPFQIRNSNSYSLAAQVIAAGGEPVILPIAPDEAAALETAIRRGLTHDMLLLSGGVSMGKYDLVEPVLLSLGAEFFFTGAKIQPGKPVVFGRVQGRYFFGLPGNPVSTMVTFALFAAPMLAALGGEPPHTPRFVQARLARAAQQKPGLMRFLPAKLESGIDGASVTPVMWQGSGDLASTALSDCFVVVPEPGPEDAELAAGTTVSVLLLA